MRQVVAQGVWIVPVFLLFIVAWVRFNSPPTNRSGTTFALFYCGMLFYYAMLVSLWLLVMVMLTTGGIGIDKTGFILGSFPNAREEIGRYAPLVSALIVVVASQFTQVKKIDAAARSFCVRLASTPGQANYLAMELARNAEFRVPREKLEAEIVELIRRNIGANALSFANDGSMAARFTRAISLYHLFILPDGNGTPLGFPANSRARSAYVRIMKLNEPVVAQAQARYETLLEIGLAYFTSAQATREMKDALKTTIKQLSDLICSLIARYVLYLDITSGQRRQRLSNMGFDTPHLVPNFGRDQWVASIIIVTVVSLTLLSIIGHRPLNQGEALMIALSFAISVGVATLAGTFVAQRFIQRDEGLGTRFPPIADLTAAGLVVVGISVALRIALPLVPALLTSGSLALEDSIRGFTERWPAVLVPLACTFSIGLLCSYVAVLEWSAIRLALAGALGNGLAFLGAGLLLTILIEDKVWIERFGNADDVKVIVVASLGAMGAILGAFVLSSFRRSIREARKIPVVVEQGDGIAPVASPISATTDSPIAPIELGGYPHDNVRDLEGRYVAFRAMFGNPEVINAYITQITWDTNAESLVFEEQSRADSSHSQRGQVYVPEGKPFVSLVSTCRGAIRVMTFARPDGEGLGRGLLITLSNPKGVQFTPAATPIVLRRLRAETPQVGFIHPGTPDYDLYRAQLASVVPDFAILCATQPAGSGGSAAEPRLTVVR